MQETDETLLLSLARHGGQPAFEALASRVERLAFSVALRITGRRELAEEAVQEALLQVWLSASSYQPTGSARAWILRIVARQSLLIVRSLQKAKREKEDTHMPQKNVGTGGLVEELEGQEMAAACRKFFERLPFGEQQLLALHYAGGLTQHEIALEMELPARTISSRMEKALKTLRANLTQAGLAAAAPLLEAAELGQVICTEVPVPLGLREKVLARIAASQVQVIQTAAVHSRRAAEAKTGFAHWLSAGLAVAVATAGGVWWAVATQAPRQPVPVETNVPANLQNPVLAAPDQVRPFYRRWTFEKGPPADIELRGSAWRWDGRRSMLAGAEGIALVFDLPHPQRPLWFEIKVRVLREKASFMGLERSDGNGLLACRMWNSRGKRGGLAVEADYLGQLCSTKMLFKERHSLAYNSDNKLYAICEFATPPPSAKVALILHLVSLEEIVMRTAAETELPAEALDPARTIQQLGWISKEIGYRPFLLQPADKR